MAWQAFGSQQVLDPRAPEQLTTYPIGDAIDDLGTVLRRVDMDAAKDLAAGTLVEVLGNYPPTPSPVSLLYPHNRQLSPRVRVFIDWLATTFARRGGEGVRVV